MLKKIALYAENHLIILLKYKYVINKIDSLFNKYKKPSIKFIFFCLIFFQKKKIMDSISPTKLIHSSSKSYPNTSNSKGNKKRKKNHNKIDNNIKNPSITHFNINSHFIYSDEDFLEYFHSKQNKNLIKLNKEELNFLIDTINEINLISNLNNINDFIELDEEMCKKIINFKTINNSEDDLIRFLKEKILNSNNRDNISCRKLYALYLKETGKFICKSTIHKVMKNKLGLHYIKTYKKSNFLITEESIFSCFAFIKILIKSLILGNGLIFIDESTFKLNKSNFKCWRKYDEQIFFWKNQ